MSDEVSRQGQSGHNDALIGNRRPKTVGKDTLPGAAGTAGHDAPLGFFAAQCQGGEAVGDQVDPQQVGRLQDGEAQHGGGEDAQDLAQVGAEQELDGLSDVGVDAAALLHRTHNGGEVVVGEHHVGYIFGDVRAGDAHAHADVRRLQSGGIVDAVSGHGGDAARLLPGPDDAGLVLRLDSGIDADAGQLPAEGIVVHLLKLGAGDSPAALLQNVQLPGDGGGRVHMVAGDHDGADARPAALGDGGPDLGTDRVYHACQA